jgi:hypothetical protein
VYSNASTKEYHNPGSIGRNVKLFNVKVPRFDMLHLGTLWYKHRTYRKAIVWKVEFDLQQQNSVSYRQKCWQCRAHTEMVKWNWYWTELKVISFYTYIFWNTVKLYWTQVYTRILTILFLNEAESFFIVNTVETEISVVNFSMLTTKKSVFNVSLILYAGVCGRVCGLWP